VSAEDLRLLMDATAQFFAQPGARQAA